MMMLLLLAGSAGPISAQQPDLRAEPVAQITKPIPVSEATGGRFALTTGTTTLQLSMAEADRLVRSTFADEERSQYHTAAQVYLGILSMLDSTLTASEGAIVRRHADQLKPLLSMAMQERIEAGHGGMGERIVRWWRAQDPLPGTAQNERVHEHLRRVVLAEKEYRNAGAPTGYDERGEIFVRLGTPSHTTRIHLNDVSDRLMQPGLTVSVSDFVENELWVYHHVDRAATYLFVNDDGRYRQGEVLDLVPAPLRRGFSNQGRGALKAERLLFVLREIYRQLSQLSDDFALRYAEVDNYIMRVEEEIRSLQGQRTSSALDGNRTVGGTDGLRLPYEGEFTVTSGGRSPFGGTLGPPHAFADAIVMRGATEDEVFAAEREKVVPRQFTEVLREVAPLDISARTARFLEPDGTTRTDIYWAPLPGTLMPDEELALELPAGSLDKLLVTLTVVQQAPDYTHRVMNLERYLITDVPTTSGLIPTQKLTVRGDQGLYHLGLQWEEFLVEANAQGQMKAGDRIKLFVSRLDSMEALSPNENVLVLSDLVPSVAPADTDLQWDEEGDPVIHPYPFGGLTPDTPLALYFELYHLTLDGDGQSNYTVEHEVVRRTGEETLWSELRGDADLRSFSTTVTSSSRTAREFILLDLAAWDGDGEVRITVRVTDNLSGQQVEREISFASILVPQVNGEE